MDCPATVFEKRRMLEYLSSEQLELRDTELAVAIINSQNNRKYRELLLMLIKIPDVTANILQCHNLNAGNHIVTSLKHNNYI